MSVRLVAVLTALLMQAGAAHLIAQVGLVEAGRDIYRRECASCHGMGGTGHGPAASLLLHTPPDITLFADGRTPFPDTTLRDRITARLRLVPSHGFTEMPFFRKQLDVGISSSGGFTELDAIVAFVEYLQLRRYRTLRSPHEDLVASGRPLFKSFCASCHGEDGRGGVPQGSYLLGFAVPDLTTMAARRAGQMDLPRVVELIAGCEDADRTSEMPPWARQFQSQGWSAVEASRHIEALASFVLSMQQQQP